MFNNLKWYAQSSIRLSIDDKTIFIDPYKITNNDKADIILITHSHFDHLSIEDINKVANSETIFYGSADVCEKLKDFRNVFEIKPYDKVKVYTINIEAYPAYNRVKTELHPKENNWLGYLIKGSDKFKYYHTGDTEYISEMENIETDLIMLPLGQTYTMNSLDEALKVVKTVKAKYVLPFHYGMYEGTLEDKDKFVEMLVNNNIEIVAL